MEMANRVWGREQSFPLMRDRDVSARQRLLLNSILSPQIIKFDSTGSATLFFLNNHLILIDQDGAKSTMTRNDETNTYNLNRLM